MKKRLMINIETKEIRAYDFSIAYRNNTWKELSFGYFVPSRHTLLGYEIKNKSKKGLFFQAYSTESDTRVYLIYNNDGTKLLRELITRCGYDRGPKLAGIINMLMESV